MSAIFGIINRKGDKLEEDIPKMQGALLHRAVDGKGVWYTEQELLGHHQLIITPEQRFEKLPFEEDNLVVTTDARIDNREHLFAHLNIERQLQTTYPDSLLILAAYKKWGESCLDYLEGDFAFAIWDKQAKQLFCAVDPIGARPLYYYNIPGQFIFSSELKGIVAVKKTSNVFNEDTLIEYFYRQSNPVHTYNKEIFALCGGNKLISGPGGIKIEQYWQPRQLSKYRFTKNEDWALCLQELLIKAVQNRLRTDLPVGITLSGGLDSSSIACIAGKILEKKNKTLSAFSSVLPENHKGVEKDERYYIEIVGKHIKNLEQHYVEPPDTGTFSNLEKVFEIEESLPNPFFYMDQAINAAAEQKGIRLLYSGFGGDFFVSWKGNPAIYSLLRQLNLGDALKIFSQSRKKEEKSIIELLKTDVVAYTGLYHAVAPLLHKNKINWQHQTTLNDALFQKYKQEISYRNKTDQVNYMINYMASGRMGRLMGLFANRDGAYNMGSAIPMFDKNIMEFMLDVPVQQFRADGIRRSLMRRAMAGILPPEIQIRQDKLPYAPDYISRIISNKKYIEGIVISEKYNFVWSYLDKERMMTAMNSLRPAAGMTKLSEIAGIRVIQGIMCCLFLEWLQANHYSLRN